MLLVGLVTSQAAWGWVIFGLSRDRWAVLAIVILTVWLLAPFIPVAAALADGEANRAAIAFSFVVATAGTALMPTLTDEAIKNNPSSTAVLVHLYDPVPVVLAVGGVFLLDNLVGRRKERTTSAL